MSIEKNVPLCVDLDRTLVKTDILLEALLALLRNNMWYIFILPYWILKGKAYLKSMIANRVTIDVETIPYNQEVVKFIRDEKNNGRDVVLVTATNILYAEQISKYLDLFSSVLASNEVVNLKSVNKRDRLESLYGKHGYDYIGDSLSDIVVWRSANRALLVTNSGPKRKRWFEKKGIQFDQVFTCNKNSYYDKIKSWLKAIRIHQWAKNILIFVPLLLSHRTGDPSLLHSSLLAFFSFSIAASANYLINDIVDLELDRSHPTKRMRVLASGEIFLGDAIVAIPLLLVSSIAILQFLPIEFALLLAAYLSITILYSFFLKKIVIVDLVILAGLYTMRIVAGAFAIEAELTFWLLAFSMFLFFSLALSKRYAELELVKERVSGRGYRLDDLPILRSLGSSSGLLAVLVFALYINSQQITILYNRPGILWFVLPVLLFWISRIWLLAHRGEIHEDPVLFAVHDRASLISAAVIILLLWLAIQF